MPGNMTHFWVWPVGKEAEADAYAAAADSFITTLDPTSSNWYPSGQLDVHGQPIVAKLWGGPWVWDGNTLPEIPAHAALRVNAVEVEDWDHPPEE